MVAVVVDSLASNPKHSISDMSGTWTVLLLLSPLLSPVNYYYFTIINDKLSLLASL